MTTAFLCVFVAGLLPYLGTIVAKSRGFNLEENKRVRAFLDSATGMRQRANWAQLNGFEAFPFFAAGVIIAHLKGADQSLVDEIAIGFVVARVAYFGFYLADNGALRSIAWMAGIVLAGALYFV